MDFFSDLFAGNSAFLMMIAGGLTVVIGFVLFMAYVAFQRAKESSYEQQLAELLEDELNIYEEGEEKDIGLLGKWSRYWDAQFKELGLSRYNDNPLRAGREVMIAFAAVALVGSVATMNPFIGPVIGVLLVFAASFIVKIFTGRKSEKIGHQLPGFLFALKANIQANETPERAILKVIDAMPSPLYDDLVVVRNHILANSTFREALEDLSEKTSSRDLKFLAACMIQATNAGANLEPQIVVIQKVLEQRQLITDEINKAARAASPAIYAASIAIPGTFIALFFGDVNAKSFWFVNPISWALLGIIMALWIAGIVLSRKLVTNIRNM
jgi:Flp pilus assembly protein TadB